MTQGFVDIHCQDVRTAEPKTREPVGPGGQPPHDVVHVAGAALCNGWIEDAYDPVLLEGRSSRSSSDVVSSSDHVVSSAFARFGDQNALPPKGRMMSCSM